MLQFYILYIYSLVYYQPYLILQAIRTPTIL